MKYFLLFCLWSHSVLSQPKDSGFVVGGYVQDYDTGERLIGASIIDPAQNVGVVSNRYGYFSLKLSTKATIKVSYVGYTPYFHNVTNTRDSLLIIRLKAKHDELTEVTVHYTGSKDTPDDVSMGRFLIPLDLLKKSPALLGESDVLKTIQFLPGVQAGSEGTVGLNVRGGSPDQNLVLLDGITLYNVNHLFGFLSVINTDAVAQADFLKGSFPARYGGRLSSVLDISLREGNRTEWKGQLGISPIASRLTLEGPLKKNTSSILISARRTWLDALYWLGSRVANSSTFTGYNFYDLNAKINYKLSGNDQLYLSFYAGQDKFGNQLNLNGTYYQNKFDWGNQTVGLRWNHLFGKKLFSNTSLYYTRFAYNLKEDYKAAKNYTNQVSSGVSDVALKTDIDWYANPNHAIKVGIGLIHHAFRPEIKQFSTSASDTTYQPALPIKTTEFLAYVEDEFRLTTRLRINAGLHYANQAVEGKLWHSLQPRVSARYSLNERSSIKAAYNQMTQYIHLLTNSSVGLPTDLWVPVTNKISPEQARILSLGYNRLIGAGWNLSLESYYKQMQNVLEYKEGTSFLNNFSTPWYERVSVGNGKAYGAEFYFERLVGRARGWLSYTLSWTNRQFTDINQGQPFPYKYDRRHNLAAVFSYDLTRTKSFAANFIYSSGYALTVAGSSYPGILPGADLLNQQTVSAPTYRDLQFYTNLPDLTQRNNYRTPAYHRLDISYRTVKQKQHGRRSWILGCYNVYNHANAFYLFYDKSQLKQFSLFPVIPSITYQYEF